MLTSITVGLNSFISSLLSSLGLHSIATTVTKASAGQAIAAGAGFIIISKIAGRVCAYLARWFIIFIIGMLLYRHFHWFSDIIDSICLMLETYVPVLVYNIQSMVK